MDFWDAYGSTLGAVQEGANTGWNEYSGGSTLQGGGQAVQDAFGGTLAATQAAAASAAPAGVSDQTIRDWLAASPGASDTTIRSTMDQYGVSTQQMANATGMGLADIQGRYDTSGLLGQVQNVVSQYAPTQSTPTQAAPAATNPYTPAAYGNQTSPTTGLLGTAPQGQRAAGSYSAGDIQHWLSVNAGASDATIDAAMQQYGITPEQMAAATGLNTADVQGRMNAATAAPAGAAMSRTDPNRDQIILNYWRDNSENTGAIRDAMRANGVSIADIARVTGYDPTLLTQFIDPAMVGGGAMGRAQPLGLRDFISETNRRNEGRGWTEPELAALNAKYGGKYINFDPATRIRGGSGFAVGGSAAGETTRDAYGRPTGAGAVPLPDASGRATGATPSGGIPSDESVRQWLQDNPGATDAQIRAAMDQTGVTPEQLARATGMSVGEITTRYNNANGTTAPKAPAPTRGTGGSQAPTYGGGSGGSSSTGWKVDDPQTVEGRLNNLLRTDDKGTYTNPVIRQAVDRAMQAFAGRGLLNSSMAQQAAQEAAISKATEIAKSDAQNSWQSGENTVAFERDLAKLQAQHDYKTGDDSIAFDRDLARLAAQHGYTLEEVKLKYGLDTSTQEANRDEALQASYRSQVSQANVNYTTTTANINNSNMTAEQKAAAMQIAAEARDSELTGINEIFAQTPRWRNEWSAVAVRVDASGVASINSESRLLSIIADPAQKADVKDAARLRLTQLRTAPPTAPAPAPAPAPGGGY